MLSASAAEVGVRVSWLARGAAAWLLAAYKMVISPLLPRACRYWPTCSQYTAAAIEKYGLRRGMVLGICRIGRCHPFSSGGYDPVP